MTDSVIAIPEKVIECPSSSRLSAMLFNSCRTA